MKKHFTTRLTLNKETLRHLSDRDLRGAVGGVSYLCSERSGCEPTGASECASCPTESCITGGSCQTSTLGLHCC